MEVDKTERLQKWQDRYDKAKASYGSVLDAMGDREALYQGTKKIDGKGGASVKVKAASHTRNNTFDLVESQVDSNIPIPKVSTTRQEDEELAREIEASLKADLERLPIEQLNDEQERTTPIQGGSYFLVEWDNSIRTHNTVGDLSISLLHPKQVIPQPGVYKMQDCDYVFVKMARSKEYIKRRYNIDVEAESEADASANTTKDKAQTSEDKVTQILAYYKNKDGGIGLISWVNDTLLEDLDDYQARQLDKCTQCGREKPYDSDVCECGNKTFARADQETETTLTDIEAQGMVIPSGTVLPYYKPNKFPLVLRKNVSSFGQLLGDSDVDKIRDQQMLINKLGSKIEEKLLKGGSYVTLPKNSRFRRDDSELKVIDVTNPADAQMINVITLQPNITWDSTEREKAYNEARSTLGVTDSFQGKPDKTATSGKAKEIQVAQSAGRLESKRRMKIASYADLFELMFKFKLAYADEPRPYADEDKNGNPEYGQFNRYDFLKMDESGRWYYDDQFLFSVDTSGTLAQNREAMWQETRMNFQQGAFGDPANPQTLLMFWQIMESLHYPKAGMIKTQIQTMMEQQEQQAMEQQMMEQQMIGQQAMEQPMEAPVVEQPPINPSQELDAVIAELGGI